MKHINAKTERGYKRALANRRAAFDVARERVENNATPDELDQMARELANQCSVSLEFAKETVLKFLMAEYLSYSNREIADDNVCEWFHDIGACYHGVSPKCWSAFTEAQKQVEREILSTYRSAIRKAGNFEILDVYLEGARTWAEVEIKEAEEAAQKALVAKKALKKLHTSAAQLRGLSVAAEGDAETAEILECILSKLTEEERCAVLYHMWN